jgi:uncharacterized protein YndB with AHSA1/START domain
MTQRESDSMKGTVVRVFQIEAPPERVFKAFTTKEDAREWIADNYEIDPRKGGKWRMGGEKDGFVGTGEVLEIVPNQLLVYTWQMNDYDPETGKKIPNWMDTTPTKVTVRFERAGRGTKVTVRHEGFPERDESYWGVDVGWDMLAGQVLKYYLEHTQAEFDRWWKENESSWQERMQKAVEMRIKTGSAGEVK